MTGSMTPKYCGECGSEFTPAKPHYWICPDCWEARFAGEHCHATNDDGEACRAWAIRGGYFCRAHVKHYGLFTLAVERQLTLRDKPTWQKAR